MTGCEALAGMALVACLARNPACLPPEHAPLLPWIVSTIREESRFAPYAVRNEAEQRGLYFQSKAAAVSYAVGAHARGQVLGLGLGQITGTANWRRHTGMDGAPAIEALLDPCANLRATARHYADDLHAAASRRFNSGRIDGAPASSVAYAARVVAGAEQLRPLLDAPHPAPAARPEPECPGAPPEWDAWATARHAASCQREAARRSTPTEGTAPR